MKDEDNADYVLHDAIDNNPRCSKCHNIIVGKIERIYGMPYDVKCYRIEVAEISKDGP